MNIFNDSQLLIIRYGRVMIMTSVVVCLKAGSQYDARPHVGHASTLLAAQCNVRIESNPIHAFPCVAFMHLVIKIR